MGDNGEMYPTYTAELCEAMGALADGADILMPNLTEASILTGTAYAGADLDDVQVNDLLQALLDLGARNVVLKGIDRNDGRIRNFVANAQAGVDAREEIVNEKLPFMCHGTGDAFASALIGASWPVSTWRPHAASRACSCAMRCSAHATSLITRTVA